MKANYAYGRIQSASGLTEEVLLRETPKYWVGPGKCWYKKSDGTLAANGGESHPRLLLDTVKSSKKPRGTGYPMTHKGTVKAPTGMPSRRQIRETKHFWVGVDGERFIKSDLGFSKLGNRLMLDSITEIPAEGQL